MDGQLRGPEQAAADAARRDDANFQRDLDAVRNKLLRRLAAAPTSAVEQLLDEGRGELADVATIEGPLAILLNGVPELDAEAAATFEAIVRPFVGAYLAALPENAGRYARIGATVGALAMLFEALSESSGTAEETQTGEASSDWPDEIRLLVDAPHLTEASHAELAAAVKSAAEAYLGDRRKVGGSQSKVSVAKTTNIRKHAGTSPQRSELSAVGVRENDALAKAVRTRAVQSGLLWNDGIMMGAMIIPNEGLGRSPGDR